MLRYPLPDPQLTDKRPSPKKKLGENAKGRQRVWIEKYKSYWNHPACNGSLFSIVGDNHGYSTTPLEKTRS